MMTCRKMPRWRWLACKANEPQIAGRPKVGPALYNLLVKVHSLLGLQRLPRARIRPCMCPRLWPSVQSPVSELCSCHHHQAHLVASLVCLGPGLRLVLAGSQRGLVPWVALLGIPSESSMLTTEVHEKYPFQTPRLIISWVHSLSPRYADRHLCNKSGHLPCRPRA